MKISLLAFFSSFRVDAVESFVKEEEADLGADLVVEKRAHGHDEQVVRNGLFAAGTEASDVVRKLDAFALGAGHFNVQLIVEPVAVVEEGGERSVGLDPEFCKLGLEESFELLLGFLVVILLYWVIRNLPQFQSLLLLLK